MKLPFFADTGELEKSAKELQESMDRLTKLHWAFHDLILDLVELDNHDVDVLLDKYEITVEGKYPRNE